MTLPGDAPSSHDRGRGSAANPARNPRLDALLADLVGPLEAAEDRLLRQLADAGRTAPRHPLVLVVGAPRSGTTVLVQWLQATGAFTVPTNAMARFAVAPGLAARIHAALFDPAYAYGEQLTPVHPEPAFRSELGKTRGAAAPNEFFFFWRRHLAQDELAPLGAERVARADWARVRAELAALESAFERPVAMKGLMVQYDLAQVAVRLPEALFVHVRRDPLDNARSLLDARRKFHGDERTWYSTRPPGSDALRGLAVEDQVVGQVLLDRAAIEAGLARLDARRWIGLDYEAFCADTGRLWGALEERFHALGHRLPREHAAPGRLEAPRSPRGDPERRRALEAALARRLGALAGPR